MKQDKEQAVARLGRRFGGTVLTKAFDAYAKGEERPEIEARKIKVEDLQSAD